jgi:hypothetical protein
MATVAFAAAMVGKGVMGLERSTSANNSGGFIFLFRNRVVPVYFCRGKKSNLLLQISCKH